MKTSQRDTLIYLRKDIYANDIRLGFTHSQERGELRIRQAAKFLDCGNVTPQFIAKVKRALNIVTD